MLTVTTDDNWSCKSKKNFEFFVQGESDVSERRGKQKPYDTFSGSCSPLLFDRGPGFLTGDDDRFRHCNRVTEILYFFQVWGHKCAAESEFCIWQTQTVYLSSLVSSFSWRQLWAPHLSWT